MNKLQFFSLNEPIKTTSNPVQRVVMQSMRKPMYSTTAVQPPTPAIIQPIVEEPKKKIIRWGQPTWFLFHTLAEKVKPELFHFVKKDLLNLIYTICVNLPCPTCADHAKSYLNGINFQTIDTKEKLKFMLFSFHNSVNDRKGVAKYSIDELDAKYKLAITTNVVQNFIIHFKLKTNSIRLLANELQRIKIVEQVKSWINANIQYFDM